MNYKFDKRLLKSKLDEINSEAAYILNTSVFENEYDLLLNSFLKNITIM